MKRSRSLLQGRLSFEVEREESRKRDKDSNQNLGENADCTKRKTIVLNLNRTICRNADIQKTSLCPRVHYVFDTVTLHSSSRILSSGLSLHAIAAVRTSRNRLATAVRTISAALASLFAHEAAAKCSHASLKTSPVIIRLARRRCLLVDDLRRRLLLILHLL